MPRLPRAYHLYTAWRERVSIGRSPGPTRLLLSAVTIRHLHKGHESTGHLIIMADRSRDAAPSRVRNSAWPRFVQLVVQLIDLRPRMLESLSALSGHSVHAASASLDDLEHRTQQASTFHTVQERVQRAGTDPISVVPELLHHRESEDILVSCVNEHMNPNETGEQLSLMLDHIMNIPSCRNSFVAEYRTSI
jgi:hypothetical protein